MLSEEQERNNLVGSVGLSWCTGCVQPIHDKYVHRVAPNLQWHAACLKCHSCQQLLVDTCFLRDRMTYCKKDYVRLFGTTCRHCATGFQEDELVVRAGPDFVYHTNCFRCVVCRRRLMPGEEFALGEAGPCCHEDHSRLLAARSSAIAGESAGDSGGRSSRCSDAESGVVVGDGLQKDVKPLLANNGGDYEHVVQPHVELCPSTGGSYTTTPPRNRYNTTSLQSATNTGSTNESPSVPGKTTSGNLTPPLTPRTPGSRTHRTGQSKSTRIRTVMSEMQLHTLRTCYAANPRPDALVKEQLVEMTGLTSRVIRVWFQNKRCKDKKRTILLKQLEHQITPDHGPMVVSSPMPLPSPTPSSADNHATDVQSISWQDISDFAFREHLESSLYPHSNQNNNVSMTSSLANDNQKLLSSDVIRESMASYGFDYHGDCPRQEDGYRSLDNGSNDDIYREEYHSEEEGPNIMSHVTSRDELRAAIIQQMCGVASQ